MMGSTAESCQSSVCRGSSVVRLFYTGECNAYGWEEATFSAPDGGHIDRSHSKCGNGKCR